MSKIIAIGDIHGSDHWKTIVNKNIDSNYIVFVGDYFDSFTINGRNQIDNFKDIIALKKSFGQQIVLLIGNHDYHYLKCSKQTYSGYQPFYAIEIQEILHESLEHLQLCFVQNNYLFVHAGLTKTWCKNTEINIDNLEHSVNILFGVNPVDFEFTPCKNKFGYDPYGDDICQSPLWVRPNSLKQDCLDNYTQIVGHTVHDQITKVENLIFIDNLTTSKEFLLIEDDNFFACKGYKKRKL